jgi:hypothetical protein
MGSLEASFAGIAIKIYGMLGKYLKEKSIFHAKPR